MRKELWSLLVATLCGAVILWDVAQADGQIFGRRHRHRAECVPCPPCQPLVEQVPVTSDWVCPLYCYAHFGTYCAYYAKRCSTGQYFSLNSTCGLPLNNCQSPYTGCTDIGQEYHRRYLTGNAGHHNGQHVKKGVLMKAPIKNPIPKGGDEEKICQLVGDPVLAWLKLPQQKPAKAMLYLIAVDPAKIGNPEPLRLFTTGVEVTTKDKPSVTIESADIEMDGDHLCTVTVGAVTYPVVLDKNRPLPP